MTVLELKNKYKNIKLILVLPYKEQKRGWSKEDIDIFNYIYSSADKIVYVLHHYFKGCMYKRNRHLIDNSDYCIYYLKHNYGGTYYIVSYAKSKGLNIIDCLSDSEVI